MLWTRIRNVLACCLHRCQEWLQIGDVCRVVLGMSHARQATHCFSLGVQGDQPVSPRETLCVQRHVTHVSCHWHGMLGTASILSSTVTATQTRDPVDHISNVILPAPLAIVDDVQTSLLSDHLIQIQNPIGWARQRAHVRCANPGVTVGIRVIIRPSTQWCLSQQSCRPWRNLHYRFQWHDSWHHRSLRMFCYGGSSFEAFQVASNGPAGWLIHDPLNGDAAPGPNLSSRRRLRQSQSGHIYWCKHACMWIWR